jgi:hypothetical protein
VKKVMETETIQTSRRSRLRIFTWCALIAAPFLFLLAWTGYEWYLNRDLQDAIADADLLDPGWRLMELEEARPEIPDEENSAVQVLAAWRLIPAGWWAKGGNPTFVEKLEQLAPDASLVRDENQILSIELAKASAALKAMRPLSDLPRGRYIIHWSPDAVGTLIPHAQEAAELCGLLQMHAYRQIQDGDIDGAIATCRAILNIGRSFGDEPVAMTQLIRLRYRIRCLRGLERALAQGEASEAALASIQRLLEDEAEQPIFLVLARADRAAIHQFLEVTERKGIDRATYGMRSRTGYFQLDHLLDRGKARGCHADYLRFLNECVEIAKLPPEQQAERLDRLDRKEPENLPDLLAGLTKDSDFKRLARQVLRSIAFLRCGIMAIACERFRLANGRWPERLDELVPRYLLSVPIDPFDRRPVHYVRKAEGVLIYTLEGEEDDGGQRVQMKPGEPDRDVGIQLWDAKQRRQK